MGTNGIPSEPHANVPSPQENGNGNHVAHPQAIDGGHQSILNIRNLVVVAILIGLILFIVKIISVLEFSFSASLSLFCFTRWSTISRKKA